MLVTAVDVVASVNDAGALTAMLERAEAETGVRTPLTLADAGYHAGPHLEASALREQRVLMPRSGPSLGALAFENITNIDRALISFGSESNAGLLQQYTEVTDEACILSGLCEDRVPEGGLPDEACVKEGCP